MIVISDIAYSEVKTVAAWMSRDIQCKSVSVTDQHKCRQS